MAEQKRRLLTPEFRMSFAKLVVPEAYKENGKAKGDPSFSVECILDPENITKFKEWDDKTNTFVDVDIRVVCAQVAKAKWEDMSVKDAVAQGGLFWPIVDGDVHIAKLVKDKGKKEDSLAHYKGKKIFRIGAAQEYPPVLTMKAAGGPVTFNRASDADMAKAKQAFKGGNYAMAEITVAAIAMANGSKYVKFYANSVRMTKPGDAIGGGGGMMNRFDGINGGKADHDPTAGMSDDDIPF